jgi:hypothetical protein
VPHCMENREHMPATAKHRKLVSKVITSDDVAVGVALLRMYHERAIDICVCVAPDGSNAASVAVAAYHGRVDVIKLLHELGTP